MWYTLVTQRVSIIREEDVIKDVSVELKKGRMIDWNRRERICSRWSEEAERDCWSQYSQLYEIQPSGLGGAITEKGSQRE
jgi:hypothetical protein